MANIPLRPTPEGVKVTDNGGPNHGGTHDRFTVVMPCKSVYSMSTNVMAEGGVCTFHGVNLLPDPNERPRWQIPLHVEQKIQELMV